VTWLLKRKRGGIARGGGTMKGAIQDVTVSMFIIRDNGEILLQQQQGDFSSSPVWGTPCFVHGDQSITVYDAAQRCLTMLGLRGKLYEIFGRELVMIAFICTDDTIDASLPPEYRWRSLRHVVQDTRERPARYSSKLKSSLEGVLLYLKTHLKDHILIDDFTHSEL